MYVILWVSNFPSGDVLVFVQLCHKTSWQLNKYITNDFNFYASVSINTKLYMWKIHVYGIEYLSGNFLLARVGRAFLVS